MANLFDINKDYMFLMDDIAYAEGEVTEEQLEQLKLNQENFEQKGENMLYVIANLKAEAEAFAEQIKRMSERKKSLENHVERLKKALLEGMHMRDIEKIKLGVFNVRVNHSKSVSITDFDALPEEYKKVKVEADKTAIKEQLKEGIDVPGAEMIENQSVVIR